MSDNGSEELAKVSVCVISYNQEDFIREALESALQQDYENLEVVVADDASTDCTQAIILELAARYPGRLKYFFNPKNLGITANSNVALKACTGEYIAFMGGDDVLLPDKIRKQVEWFAEDEKRVLCGHEIEYIDSNGNLLGKRHSDLAPLSSGKGIGSYLKNGAPFGACSVMIRSSRIPEYGFDLSLPIASDIGLWLDVIREDGVYGFIPGIYSYYRRHPMNITQLKRYHYLRDNFVMMIKRLWQYRGKYFLDWIDLLVLSRIRKRIFGKAYR